MRYECLTEEQQAIYDKLLPRQRMFIDNRCNGLNGAQAALRAGYPERTAKQIAYNMEKKHKEIQDLIKIILASKGLANLQDAESVLNKKINKLAKQETDLRAIEAIENADGEQLKRITFYRDIISGATKSVRVKKKFDAKGKLLERVVEEYNDIDMRMRARKELDVLLGYDKPVDLGKFKMGDITINIVDASKKDKPKEIVEGEAEPIVKSEEFYEVAKNGDK